MKVINLEKILKNKIPLFFEKYPSFIVRVILFLLEKLLHIREINKFIKNNSEKQGIEFLDALFDELNFKFKIDSEDKRKILPDGRLLIISNHPLGGLDGLAIIKTIHEVRKDVKIVVNDVLLEIDNLAEFFLPFDLYSKSSQRDNLRQIDAAFDEERAVIFFPAGKVSRLSIKGINDTKWQNGAIRFGLKYRTPILPVFIKGRNSFKFYIVALMNNIAAMLLLPSELFNKRNKQIEFIIGDIIPSIVLQNHKLKVKALTSMFYKHLYNIGKGKKGFFQTEKTIIEPVEKSELLSELEKLNLLGKTSNEKNIYLVDSKSNQIMREIARLREVTFRKVGEGTGREMDFDEWDNYYKHILLWDKANQEIVGSYRLGNTNEIIQNYGQEALYNSSMFKLNFKLDDDFANSIEVGRSFVQQKYWNSKALDYIWQGIGSYLKSNRNIRYLWGAVSISDSYSSFAKDLIICYYKKWYQGNPDIANPINPYIVSKIHLEEIALILNSNNHIEDFTIMKSVLKNLGFSIPVLYRKYVDLCEFGGVKFINWTVNKNFNNSVDGLMIMDLNTLKPESINRYL